MTSATPPGRIFVIAPNVFRGQDWICAQGRTVDFTGRRPELICHPDRMSGLRFAEDDEVVAVDFQDWTYELQVALQCVRSTSPGPVAVWLVSSGSER